MSPGAPTLVWSWPAAVALLWGLGGFLLLMVSALWRLTPMALAPLNDGSLSWWQGVLYVGFAVFNAYAEGFRGFQRGFSPRLASRVLHLTRRAPLRHLILAPLFCLGLVYATRRRLLVSWCLLLGITALVIAVRQLEQPWRGIIDAGVVVGLAWGLLATLVQTARVLTGRAAPVDPELGQP